MICRRLARETKKDTRIEIVAKKIEYFAIELSNRMPYQVMLLAHLCITPKARGHIQRHNLHSIETATGKIIL